MRLEPKDVGARGRASLYVIAEAGGALAARQELAASLPGTSVGVPDERASSRSSSARKIRKTPSAASGRPLQPQVPMITSCSSSTLSFPPTGGTEAGSHRADDA